MYINIILNVQEHTSKYTETHVFLYINKNMRNLEQTVTVQFCNINANFIIFVKELLLAFVLTMHHDNKL